MIRDLQLWVPFAAYAIALCFLRIADRRRSFAVKVCCSSFRSRGDPAGQSSRWRASKLVSMQLVDFLFLTVIGAMSGVLLGYFVFGPPGAGSGFAFQVWLDNNLQGSAGLWALGGAAVGFVGRYLRVTRV